MTRPVITAALLLIVGAGTNSALSACGDKYLVLGRGTRYERSPAARRASAILLYASPASGFSQAITRMSVNATLQKAGYMPTTVATSAEFEKAFRERKWDVIVVDGRDGDAVRQRAQGAAATRVVPVLMRPAKDELKQARKLYPIVADNPTKGWMFIDMLDDVMDQRDADARAAKKATR